MKTKTQNGAPVHREKGGGAISGVDLLAAEQAFRDAARAAGLILPLKLVYDKPGGRFPRCGIEGKPKGKDGSYLFHPDGIPAGGWMNWRTGVWENWRADIGRELTADEAEAERQRREQRRRELEEEEKRNAASARRKATELLEAATLAADDHPYLARKGVGAHGLLQDSNGDLLIPARDIKGALQTLQRIAPQKDQKGRDKAFLFGGKVTGAFHHLGELQDGDDILIGEGLATMATIHEATGKAVVIAFNRGNLLPVGTALRQAFPTARLVFCADDDWRTQDRATGALINPGLTDATAAASACRGVLIKPAFGEGRADGDTDFNDMAVAQGLDAVRAHFEAALADGREEADAAGGIDRGADVDALARMAPADFEAVKKERAQRLGITASGLARAVSVRRTQIKTEEKAAAKELARERIAAIRDSDKPKYSFRKGRTYHHSVSNTGDEFEKEIANFTATITSQDVLDDGAEESRVYSIRAVFKNSVREFTVHADQFDSMKWVRLNLDAKARVSPGITSGQHTACAFSELSDDDIQERRIYAHTGWREIEGRTVYLHAGGAVGPDGAVADIHVSLPGKLRDLVLIEPESQDVLSAAVADALALLDVARLKVSAATIGNAIVAPITRTAFTPHMEGVTGALKSSFSGVVQCFWGTKWSFDYYPCSWTQSATVLEHDLSAAKDAMIVVDEFKPNSETKGAAKLYDRFDEIIRAKANGAPRSRARPDGSKRPERPIRAAILSTGEDIPKGHSCIARTFILEVVKGDIDKDKLEIAQGKARDGVYSRAMWGFIRWLAAGNLAPAQETIQAAIADGRAGHDGKSHLRTSESTATLKGAWRVFLRFAVEARAITERDAAARLSAIEATLDGLADAQGDFLKNEDPLNKFVSFLNGLFASGGAHATTIADGRPEDASAWGWQDGPAGWAGKGPRIAWIDGDDVYLEPAATYAAVQSFARQTNDGIPFTEQTLWKRMSEKGLLKSTCVMGGKRRLKVQRTLSGKRSPVIHIDRGLLQPAKSDAAEGGSDASDAPSDADQTIDLEVKNASLHHLHHFSTVQTHIEISDRKNSEVL